MKRIITTLLFSLPLIASAQSYTKKPFSTTPTPQPNTVAYTNNGLMADSFLVLPFYKTTGSDTALIYFDANGRAQKITKSQLQAWATAVSSITYAHNGLTKTGDSIGLGGTLTSPSTIFLNGNSLGLSGTATGQGLSVTFTPSQILLNQNATGTASKSILMNGTQLRLLNTKNSDSNSSLVLNHEAIYLTKEGDTLLSAFSGDNYLRTNNNIDTLATLSDFRTAISPYMQYGDTVGLSNRINAKQNLSDTNFWDASKAWVNTNYTPASGSANYLQNQLLGAQSANAWANGTIRAGALEAGYTGAVDNSFYSRRSTDGAIITQINSDNNFSIYKNFQGSGHKWNIAGTDIATLSPTAFTAPSFVKSGGTSSQFLKADGSTDNNTYATETWVNAIISSLPTPTLQQVLNTGSTLTGNNSITTSDGFIIKSNGGAGIDVNNGSTRIGDISNEQNRTVVEVDDELRKVIIGNAYNNFNGTKIEVDDVNSTIQLQGANSTAEFYPNQAYVRSSGKGLFVDGGNNQSIIGDYNGDYNNTKITVDDDAQTITLNATQGFLPPRMTSTQGSAISSPAEGLLIYVTDTNGTFTSKGWWGYNGSAWEKLNN